MIDKNIGVSLTSSTEVCVCSCCLWSLGGAVIVTVT